MFMQRAMIAFRCIVNADQKFAAKVHERNVQFNVYAVVGLDHKCQNIIKSRSDDIIVVYNAEI